MEDDASFQVLNLVYEQPTELQGQSNILVDRIQFTMRLETEPENVQ